MNGLSVLYLQFGHVGLTYFLLSVVFLFSNQSFDLRSSDFMNEMPYWFVAKLDKKGWV